MGRGNIGEGCFRLPSIEFSPEEINIHRNGHSRRSISRQGINWRCLCPDGQTGFLGLFFLWILMPSGQKGIRAILEQFLVYAKPCQRGFTLINGDFEFRGVILPTPFKSMGCGPVSRL